MLKIAILISRKPDEDAPVQNRQSKHRHKTGKKMYTYTYVYLILKLETLQ